jgi:hypothetical protein
MHKIHYHSVSGQPFSTGDSAEDSEEDQDSDCVKEYEEKQIDDFITVNSQEKKFMKIWNFYIHTSHTKELYHLKTCLHFIDKNYKELRELQTQWSLHLITLLEYHVLTADDLLYLQLYLKKKLSL